MSLPVVNMEEKLDLEHWPYMRWWNGLRGPLIQEIHGSIM